MRHAQLVVCLRNDIVMALQHGNQDLMELDVTEGYQCRTGCVLKITFCIRGLANRKCDRDIGDSNGFPTRQPTRIFDGPDTRERRLTSREH